jgi:hypothetical protein
LVTRLLGPASLIAETNRCMLSFELAEALVSVAPSKRERLDAAISTKCQVLAKDDAQLNAMC